MKASQTQRKPFCGMVYQSVNLKGMNVIFDCASKNHPINRNQKLYP